MAGSELNIFILAFFKDQITQSKKIYWIISNMIINNLTAKNFKQHIINKSNFMHNSILFMHNSILMVCPLIKLLRDKYTIELAD